MKLIIDIPEDIYKKYMDDRTKTVDVLNAVRNGTPLPRCNQCRYYEGVHNVQGHAPCKFHGSGGVLWYWYCSQFKLEDRE